MRKGIKIGYRLVKSENCSGFQNLEYELSERFNAGDVVKALLKHTSYVNVSWCDDSDDGMKKEDSCTGQEFVDRGMRNARGGCSYSIKATYNDGTGMTFGISANERYKSSCTLSVIVEVFFWSEEQIKALQDIAIPRLMGWIEDDEGAVMYIKTCLHETFGDYNDYPYYGNMYIMRDEPYVDLSVALRSIADDYEHGYNPDDHTGFNKKYYPRISVLFPSREQFERLSEDNGLVEFCRRSNIHALLGSWRKYYDLFDENEYELESETGWNSADSAETTYHLFEKEIIPDEPMFQMKTANGSYMDRKLMWESDLFDEIGSLYKKAEGSRRIGKELEKLEQLALSEAEKNCGKGGLLTGFFNAELTPEEFNDLDVADKEMAIKYLSGLGLMGIDKISKHYIEIYLSRYFIRTCACTMFEILNQLEREEKKTAETDSKWYLKIRAPQSWGKGSERYNWEKMLSRILGFYIEGSFSETYFQEPDATGNKDVPLKEKFTAPSDNSSECRNNKWDDYKEIYYDKFYADKTLIIQSIQIEDSHVTVLKGPNGIGRTTALSTIKAFFEVEFDDEGYMVDTKKYIEGKKILGSDTRVLKHFDQHPVLYISFEGVSGKNWRELFYRVKMELLRELDRHKCVLECVGLPEEEKVSITTALKTDTTPYQHGKEDNKRLKEDMKQFLRVFGLLSSSLKKYHQQNTIILIDDYDIPLENSRFIGAYDKMAGFLRALFENMLITNRNLEFAVITGNARMSEEAIFDGFENVTIYSVFDEKYKPYFGLSYDEVLTMFSSAGINVDKDVLKKEMTEWCEKYCCWFHSPDNDANFASDVRYGTGRVIKLINDKFGGRKKIPLPIKPYTSEMLEKWKDYFSNEQECPQEWRENQYGKYYFRDDKSMKLYVFQIPLEPKRYWFLTIFVSYDDPSNKLKVKNYSLDYEDAEDSHYEFMVTEEKICKKFGIEPDHKRMYLHEYFCEYLTVSRGQWLLSKLSPYITAEYHFD